MKMLINKGGLKGGLPSEYLDVKVHFNAEVRSGRVKMSRRVEKQAKNIFKPKFRYTLNESQTSKSQALL